MTEISWATLWLLRTTLFQMPSVRLILHFLHGWLIIMCPKQPQFSAECQIRDYRHNISTIILSLWSPNTRPDVEPFDTSLCTFKTIKYCNSRILLNATLPQNLTVLLSSLRSAVSPAVQSSSLQHRNHPTLVNPQTDTEAVFHQIEMVCGEELHVEMLRHNPHSTGHQEGMAYSRHSRKIINPLENARATSWILC